LLALFPGTSNLKYIRFITYSYLITDVLNMWTGYNFTVVEALKRLDETEVRSFQGIIRHLKRFSQFARTLHATSCCGDKTGGAAWYKETSCLL
jgi:hypothetical protein